MSNSRVKFMPVALAGALAAGLALGATSVSNGKETGSPPGTTTPSPALSVTLVGNQGRCDERTGATFQFQVKGAAPGEHVMILVFYPGGLTDPVYHNSQRFYWYQQDFGIYTVPADGTVLSRPWNCLKGPTGVRDSRGTYSVKAVDLDRLPTTRFITD